VTSTIERRFFEGLFLGILDLPITGDKPQGIPDCLFQSPKTHGIMRGGFFAVALNADVMFTSVGYFYIIIIVNTAFSSFVTSGTVRK